MPLNEAGGNMYSWVTHTWNPIAGACPHECEYCYVEDLKSKPVLAEKYSGEPRLAEKEMNTKLGSGKVIFVQNCGDLFAEGVDKDIILRVFEHIEEYDEGNRYLFQTKNPGRMLNFAYDLPPDVIIGTTVESDVPPWSHAPHWIHRLTGLAAVSNAYEFHNRKQNPNVKLERMVSIEPIVKVYDLDLLAQAIHSAFPKFVSIGADSKNMGLDEPEPWEIMKLAIALGGKNPQTGKNIEVILKPNLKRIVGKKLWKEMKSYPFVSEF